MASFNIFRRKSSKLGGSSSPNTADRNLASNNDPSLLSPTSPLASTNMSPSNKDSRFSFSNMMHRSPSTNSNTSSASNPTRRPAEGAHRPFTTPGIHADAPPSYTAATSPSNANNAPFNPASYGPGNPTPPTSTAYPSSAAAAATNTTPATDSPFSALSTFDTIFLIDDSGSMAGRSWREVSSALRTIAPICTEFDADGIDIHFLNAPDRPFFQNIKSAATVDEIFSQVAPRGGTPTGARLHAVLKPYLARCADAFERKLPGGIEAHVKPLNVIVITDGVPSDDVESVILNACKKLEAYDCVSWQVGIQFFQVGEEMGARQHLKELDDEMGERCAGGRDIVDTVPWEGVRGRGTVFGQYGEESGGAILKVVLGSVNRRLDRKKLSLDMIRR